MAELTTEDLLRLWADIRDRAEGNAERPWIWVKDLLRVSTALTRSATPELATAFWLRLFGTLDELVTHFAQPFDGTVDVSTVQIDIALFRPIHEALQSLLSEFTEDERIYIHYRRDTEAHVWQHSYRLGRRKSSLKEDRHYSLLGRKLSHDEARERRQRLMCAYNVNELAIAVAFAKRCLPLIARLHGALIAVRDA